MLRKFCDKAEAFSPKQHAGLNFYHSDGGINSRFFEHMLQREECIWIRIENEHSA